MQQVDFYILGEHSNRNLKQMVCQLCEKALSQNMNVVIYAASLQQAQELDELLWTYKDDSFIAHINLNNLELDSTYQYPVLITSDDINQNIPIPEFYNQFLINLNTEPPSFYSRFKRLAEMVDNDTDTKEIARNRYRYYRQQGYDLNKYDL